MARPIFVVALVLIALVGFASAAEPAKQDAAPAHGNDNVGDDAVAPSTGFAFEGPVGSVEAVKGALASVAQGPGSGSTTIGATSAVAGAAVAAAFAGYFVF